MMKAEFDKNKEPVLLVVHLAHNRKVSWLEFACQLNRVG